MQAIQSFVPRAPIWSRLLRVVSLAAFLFAAPGAFAVDVNTATQEQLLTVRGIGPKTAQMIMQERQRGGRYQSLQDLSDRVKGIGPQRAAAMRAAGLTVQGAAGAVSATSAPQAQARRADTPQDKPQAVRRAR